MIMRCQPVSKGTSKDQLSDKFTFNYWATQKLLQLTEKKFQNLSRAFQTHLVVYFKRYNKNGCNMKKAQLLKDQFLGWIWTLPMNLWQP